MKQVTQINTGNKDLSLFFFFFFFFKAKKNCQIITGGVTGLKEIVKKVLQGNEIIRS